MVTCQNRLAAQFAFPTTAAAVADRMVTLSIPCHEEAGATSELRSAAGGRARQGATAKTYYLCPNHSDLFVEIDRELIQDGWAPAHVGKPVPLA